MGNTQFHQAVIGRMEFDLVQPVAEAVHWPEARLVLIGREAEADHFTAG